ncbi:MAG: hypothetical protein A2018_03225 [Alphaproteobacteria bacterium GWF2_58_20]|nr:MAG: hypothetical protein A2018_03225 [Alphaproteobacteria bacterium GWF2_58_20]
MGNRTMMFLERSLSETMTLLEESRVFLARVEAGEEESLTEGRRMGFHAASMRLAARLSEVMCWLLAQKAADSGEMTPEQALSPAFALSNLDVCASAEGEEDESLPERFRGMMRQSRILYERVKRLDEQMRGDPPLALRLPEDLFDA